IIKRKSVDLPQPLGPISTVVLPRSKERSEGWSAAVAPNALLIPRSSTSALTTCFLIDPRGSAKIYSVAIPSEGHASACPGRTEDLFSAQNGVIPSRDRRRGTSQSEIALQAMVDGRPGVNAFPLRKPVTASAIGGASTPD